MKLTKYFTTSEGILRLGVFGTFLGHGVFALGVKQSWIPYFTNLGFSEGFATTALPLIGIMDIVVALIALLYPLRIVLAWAAVWGFWTALVRPASGGSWLDFVERSANWAAPLALLMLRGWPKKVKGWITK